MVYDAPLVKEPFSKRLDVLAASLIHSRSDLEKKHVVLHKQDICKSQEHLDAEMDRVIDIKGEGLMLKDPNSLYENKRSDKLLKVKKFDDAEAEVVGHEAGTGRCTGLCGAIRVKHCDSGVTFKIGSGFTDALRKNPPKIGSKVTFKYQGLTNDKIPRFPIFMRLFHEVDGKRI